MEWWNKRRWNRGSALLGLVADADAGILVSLSSGVGVSSVVGVSAIVPVGRGFGGVAWFLVGCWLAATLVDGASSGVGGALGSGVSCGSGAARGVWGVWGRLFGLSESGFCTPAVVAGRLACALACSLACSVAARAADSTKICLTASLNVLESLGICWACLRMAVWVAAMAALASLCSMPAMSSASRVWEVAVWEWCPGMKSTSCFVRG